MVIEQHLEDLDLGILKFVMIEWVSQRKNSALILPNQKQNFDGIYIIMM